jgi:pyridoxal phosphate enzyme (YggS family)
MSPIAANLKQVRDRIDAACRAAGRSPSEVKLIAVSKTFPAAAVREAFGLEQVSFGENRFQEADLKMRDLTDLRLDWHFLGQIQSNKLHRILRAFGTVQSLDRPEIIEKAERALTEGGMTRDGLIEVNISGEESKSGFSPRRFLDLLQSGSLQKLKQLKIRGLMGIAPHTDRTDRIRSSFDLLRNFYEQGRSQGLAWDTLSMGMSSDLEHAIATGSTMVRVGTAVFGAR